MARTKGYVFRGRDVIQTKRGEQIKLLFGTRQNEPKGTVGQHYETNHCSDRRGRQFLSRFDRLYRRQLCADYERLSGRRPARTEHKKPEYLRQAQKQKEERLKAQR